MLCQACGKNPATTHVKTIINGELTEYSLCADCAQKMGYGNLFPGFGMNVGSLLSSFFGPQISSSPSLEVQRCPGCGSSFEDIARAGRVGCAECYHTFYDRLLPSIQKIHGNTKHCGKHPSGSMLKVKPEEGLQVMIENKVPSGETLLEEKRRLMKEAVEAQNFEEAAKLRDEIKELERGDQK